MTCERVIIINEGKLVADGTTEELSHGDSDNRYHILVEAEDGKRGDVKEKLNSITGVTNISEITEDNGAIDLMLSAEGNNDLRRDIFCCVRDNGWILLEMQRKTASLEDVFRKLTREG